MASIIQQITKFIDGVKTSIYPVTSSAAVLDFSTTTPKTQQEINQELQEGVEDAKEQYHHVTSAWYSEADANTYKEGSTWTPIDPAKDYLDKDAIYVLEDATYGSMLESVINEMFIPISKDDYDALVTAGTVNPLAYYFIIYPETSADDDTTTSE